MEQLCIKCKGRNFCGKKCKYLNMNFKSVNFSKDFNGSTPTIFVGKANYPDVKLSIMSLPFESVNAKSFDDPKLWSQEFNINQVINKRRLLINCSNKSTSFFDKFQEIALSKKPVNVEVNLDKKPKAKDKFDFTTTLMGPYNSIKKLQVNENISFNKLVSKCYYDTDLKSADAVNILYSKGFNENDLSKFLSSGAFGIKKNRKVVPTRWSITATDDTIGKKLISEIKNNDIIEHFEILQGNFFGNYFTILLLPNVFGFELFETMDKKSFTHDYEEYSGRKKYAFETSGGYYAARIGVLEYLIKNKIQARAIVLRVITDEYIMPLGVWVVREAVRKSVNNKIKFESKNDFVTFLKKNNLGFLTKKSILFEKFNEQKLLRNFL